MKYLLTIFALLFVTISFAQVNQYVFLFKKNGERVFNKDSVNYIRVVKKPVEGSKLYKVLEYYQSGQLKTIGQSSGIDPVLWEGTYTAYWPNGNKKISASYKKSKLTGADSSFFNNGQLHAIIEYSQSDSTLTNPDTQWLTTFIKTCNDSTGKALVVNGNGYFKDYDDDSGSITEEGSVKNGNRAGEWQGGYPSIKMTYKEIYDSTGTLISGTSTDPDGIHPYKKRHVSAQFKGGISAFYKYLSRNIRYPSIARENNIQGKVILSFKINKLGKLEDIKTIQTVSPEIDGEAIRVVGLSPNWEPGIAFGRVVQQAYTLPVMFSLKSQPFNNYRTARLLLILLQSQIIPFRVTCYI